MNDLMTVFGRLLQQSQYTTGQVAVLSGVPKRTLHNWVQGHVQRPRRWQAIINVANAMRLSQTETNSLLRAASHDTLDQLRQRATTEERQLLKRWEPPLLPGLSPPPNVIYSFEKEEQIAYLISLLKRGEFVIICPIQ